MSQDDIRNLIKMQTDGMPSWDIEKQSIVGVSSSEVCYLDGMNLYASVVLQDQESIVSAVDRIIAVMEDEIVNPHAMGNKGIIGLYINAADGVDQRGNCRVIDLYIIVHIKSGHLFHCGNGFLDSVYPGMRQLILRAVGIRQLQVVISRSICKRAKVIQRRGFAEKQKSAEGAGGNFEKSDFQYDDFDQIYSDS